MKITPKRKWRYPFGIERDYQRLLRSIVKVLHQHTLEHIYLINSRLDESESENITKKLIDSYNRTGNLHAVLNQLESHSDKVNRWTRKEFYEVLGNVMEVDIFTAEPDLRNITQEWISENVRLVKSIPEQYYDKLQGVISKAITQGFSEKHTATEIKKLYDVTNERAQLIARDQIGTINGQISKKRQQEAGIEEYIWSTSHDQRVRNSHKTREGKVYRWDEAPEDGHPGIPIRCRCVALPVIDIKNTMQSVNRNGFLPVKDDIIKEKRFTPAKDLRSAEEYIINELGFQKVNYQNIDVDIANEVNETLFEMFTEYPFLKGFIQTIKTDGRINSTAQASIVFKNGKLETSLVLSKKDLNNMNDFKNLCAKCEKYKWWTPKNGVSGIIKHELGHMIEYAAIFAEYNANLNITKTTKIKEIFSALKKKELASKIKQRSLQKQGLTDDLKTIKDHLSEYGFKNPSEFLAEAISEHNPRELAKTFVELLKEELKVIFNDPSTD